MSRPEVLDDRSDRSIVRLNLEVAYRILRDYKGLETSEEYLEEFVEKLLSESPTGNGFELSPSTIEQWLDKELDAPAEYLTGQKRDHPEL